MFRHRVYAQLHSFSCKATDVSGNLEEGTLIAYTLLNF